MAQSWAATERLFRDYLLSTGRAPGTATTYVYNFHAFWKYCGLYEVSAYDVDRRIIRSWVSQRLTEVSAERVHNELAAVRVFFAWLRDTRDRDDDPTEGIRVKRGKSLPTKPFAPEEVAALLSACKTERDRMILLVFASTGVRISELAGMQAEDIDWRNGRILIRGKGDKQRLVEPTPEILNRLHAFLGMFPTGAIWISQRGNPLAAHQIRKILYGLGADAKVDGVHPHRLRATFATSFIDQHGDIQALQGVMGHESIETTSRYTEYTKQKRGLQQMRSLRFIEELAAGA